MGSTAETGLMSEATIGVDSRDFRVLRARELPAQEGSQANPFGPSGGDPDLTIRLRRLAGLTSHAGAGQPTLAVTYLLHVDHHGLASGP